MSLSKESMKFDSTRGAKQRPIGLIVYSPNKEDGEEILKNIYSELIGEANSDAYIGMLYGLSRNAYDACICNHCMYCEHCQNDNVTIIPGNCPFRARLSKKSKYLMNNTRLVATFTEGELKYLNKKHCVVPEAFDALQEALTIDITEYFGIPLRLKTSRIFQFL